MFKISEIKELIKLLDQTSVQELEIENDGFRLSLRKPSSPEVVAVNAVPHPAAAAPMVEVPASAPAAESTPAQADLKSKREGLHEIKSPMVGTFYTAPSPDAAPFVNVGQRVHEKSVVCILEAMKLMNELEADVKGEIVEVLVDNGQLVEYGQPLFLVRSE